MVENPPEKRDYIKIRLDPNDKGCEGIRETTNKYDEAYESNYEKIFDEETRKYLGKTDKKGRKPNEYDFKASITEAKVDDNEQNEETEKKNEEYKFDTCKFKLNMSWAYYYDGKKLDDYNTKVIKKATNDKKKQSKGVKFDKSMLDSIEVELKFEENGEEVTKKN